MSNSRTPSPASEGPGSCSIIITGQALDAVEQHMSDDTAIEYGGVLVGTADPLIGLVIVTGHEPIPEAFAADTVTFTRETWEYMTRLVITRHPGERIVGWYHSHPRFGIFLSAHDVTIHTTYFAQPWQVAYVYDPVQRERGFFGWADHDIVRIPTWEVTAPMDGIVTSLPAAVPAHGEFVAARLAAGGTVAGEVDEVEAIDDRPADAPDAAMTPVPARTAPTAAAATTGGARPSMSGGRRRLGAALVVAAVAVGAVIAFVVGGNDDSKSGSSTVPSTSPVSTDASTTDSAPDTSVATTSSTSDTTTVPTDATTTSTPPTAGEALPTPADVTAPADRVAGSVDACAPKDDGGFSPESDCFVALNNGNVLVYSGGALQCADPPGTALAAQVATFLVGVQADPLAVVADGQLVPKCSDLTYARNVLADGSSSLAGLCGNDTATIDDSTLRCFAQNTASGAMLALVAGGSGAGTLIGACYAGGAATSVPLTWTKTGVDTTWRIVSVVFDPAQDAFVASATRNGVPTTAQVSCG